MDEWSFVVEPCLEVRWGFTASSSRPQSKHT